MPSTKKILLSGVKPTGRPHLGNYFGAMRQFVELQGTYESFIFIADYHALTTVQNSKELGEYSLGVALDYLAIGLDPKKVTLFKQSDIPEHTELAWIFNCITSMPYLERAHAYKDARAKDKEINVGIFDYPMLMAADILLYDADVVPVGHDQKQHLEYARDTAAKFNRVFGETFKIPEPLILKEVETVPGIDGRKMSKNYQNTIELFASDEEITERVMMIVTDSKTVGEPKDPDTDNVFKLHKLFATKAELSELAERYRHGGIGYRESKELLGKRIIAFMAPLRERRAKFEHDQTAVLEIIREGGKRARERAQKKMVVVRRRIGTLLGGETSK